MLLTVLQAGWSQKGRGRKGREEREEGADEREKGERAERERGRGLRLRPLTVDGDGAAGLRIDSPTM